MRHLHYKLQKCPHLFKFGIKIAIVHGDVHKTHISTFPHKIVRKSVQWFRCFIKPFVYPKFMIIAASSRCISKTDRLDGFLDNFKWDLEDTYIVLQFVFKTMSVFYIVPYVLELLPSTFIRNVIGLFWARSYTVNTIEHRMPRAVLHAVHLRVPGPSPGLLERAKSIFLMVWLKISFVKDLLCDPG